MERDTGFQQDRKITEQMFLTLTGTTYSEYLLRCSQRIAKNRIGESITPEKEEMDEVDRSFEQEN